MQIIPVDSRLRGNDSYNEDFDLRKRHSRVGGNPGSSVLDDL
jgi:hypothetical protein